MACRALQDLILNFLFSPIYHSLPFTLYLYLFSYSAFRSHLKCDMFSWPLLDQVSLPIAILTYCTFPLWSFTQLEIKVYVRLCLFLTRFKVPWTPHFLAWKFQDPPSSDFCRLTHNYALSHSHPHILIKTSKNYVIVVCPQYCFLVFSYPIFLQLFYYLL